MPAFESFILNLIKKIQGFWGFGVLGFWGTYSFFVLSAPNMMSLNDAI